MQYRWLDYTSEYASLVESWIDEEAKRFTGCDEGWEEYFNYWKNDSQTQIGVNFWGKIICQEYTPIAVISIGFCENRFTISEFIVAPQYRNKGHGAAILRELLAQGESVIGRPIQSALAVIYPNNIPSQKAFEKAGFVFESAHPDGDAWYYTYDKSVPCFCGHDCARCKTYLATFRGDESLRRESQQFYKREFGLDIPLSELRCHGGRSEQPMRLCRECPWVRCAKERGLNACADCGEYPCKPLAEYRDKYVNKCNQI